MSVAVAVVPVLPPLGRPGGLPVMSVRLHGQPLFVHAARTVVEVVEASSVVVSAPDGGGRSVRAALDVEGVGDVEVTEGGETLGAVLTSVLSTPGGRRYPRSAAVLVHDPRCPLVPASYLVDVMAAARADPAAVLVATRPMTDTVKSVVDGVVLATVDRNLLRVLSSPLVLPVGLVHDLLAEGGLADCADVEQLVEVVRAAGARVRWTPAPGLARRVSDAAAVSVLECLTEVRASSTG